MVGYINSTIRMKLSDFLGKPIEEQVYEKLSHLVSVSAHPFPIYFWYDGTKKEVSPKQMKDFIDKWESRDSISTKTLIRTSFFDNFNEYIWWDIRPYGMERPKWVRCSYEYSNPNGILDGIDELLSFYKFVTNQQEKKQKRNDDESSNYRIKKLH
jgi:hypothetical protein|tara:strand:+ start:3461 stop:3925 length:465 start_codon:yes stop_codon:yes gene_type:complete